MTINSNHSSLFLSSLGMKSEKTLIVLVHDELIYFSGKSPKGQGIFILDLRNLSVFLEK